MAGHGDLRGFTGVYTRRRWRPKAGGGGAEAMRPTRAAVNARASGRAGEHLLDVEDAEAAAASGDAGNGGGRGWTGSWRRRRDPAVPGRIWCPFGSGRRGGIGRAPARIRGCRGDRDLAGVAGGLLWAARRPGGGNEAEDTGRVRSGRRDSFPGAMSCGLGVHRVVQGT